jgi:hypothetical protein
MELPMNLTLEIKETISQKLFDSYGIKLIKFKEVNTKFCIQYPIEGVLGNNNFVGSINIFKKSTDSEHYDFYVTGWFVDNSVNIVNCIKSNNILIQSIDAMKVELSNIFNIALRIKYNRLYIGTGSFTCLCGFFSNFYFDASPDFYIDLYVDYPFVTDECMSVPYKLISAAYINDPENHRKKINYQSNEGSTSFTSIFVGDCLEHLKKMVLTEYIVAYEKISENSIILPRQEFELLTSEKMMDQLKVQAMQDIK